jgi:hypothetical protein
MLLVVLTLLLAQLPARAETNVPSDDIPDLNPARGEIPPGFWEQHGREVAVASVLGALALAGLGWWWLRPRPVVPEPPQVVARRDLEPLIQQPESKAVLSRVSHVLRQYVVGALGLPPGQRNTTEFCQELNRSSTLDDGLNGRIAAFLRECDQRKFDPGATGPPLHGAEQALMIVAAVERELETRRVAARPEGASPR